MTAKVDGVQQSQVDIRLEEPKQKSCNWFDPFQTFGLLAYFICLYAVYAGFFTALLYIALNVRKENYMRLNKKLTGHHISDNAYTTPWMWLKDNGL